MVNGITASQARQQTRTTLARQQTQRRQQQRPVSRVPFPKLEPITEINKEVSDLAKEANTTVEIALEALNLAERKLSGRRIPFRDDPDLSRAVAIVFNRPEFLRERSGQLGRRAKTVQTQTLLSQTLLPSEKQLFTPLPKSTAETRARERERRILSTSSEKLNLFEKTEKFLLERRGGELPFGIQEVVDLRPGIVSGQEFSPFAPINFFARKAEENIVGSSVLQQISKEIPIFEDLDTIVKGIGIEREASEFLTLAQLGVFFDPAITRGTAKQKAKAKQKQKLSQTKFDDLDLDDVISDLQFKKEGAVLKSKTFSEKVDDANVILEKIKSTTDKKLRKKQSTEFKKLLRLSHGEKDANRILNELASQQVLSRVSSKLIIREKLPEVKGVGQLTTTFGSKKNTEMVKKAREKNQKRIQQAKIPISERVKVGGSKLNQERIKFAQLTLAEKIALRKKLRTETRFSQLSSTALTQQERFSQLQKISQKTSEIQKQKNKIRTLQAQKTTQKTIQKEMLKLKTLQKLRSDLRTKQLQKLRSRLKSKPKIKKLGIPIFFLLPKGKIKVKKKPTISKGKFKMFSFKKNKVVKIGSATTKKRAIKKGKRIVNRTLRASLFITKNNRRIPLPISKGFRRSKVRKNVLVELKSRRLDTKSETQAIARKRRLAEPKLKSSKMIKMKRKRK